MDTEGLTYLKNPRLHETSNDRLLLTQKVRDELVGVKDVKEEEKRGKEKEGNMKYEEKRKMLFPCSSLMCSLLVIQV